MLSEIKHESISKIKTVLDFTWKLGNIIKASTFSVQKITSAWKVNATIIKWILWKIGFTHLDTIKQLHLIYRKAVIKEMVLGIASPLYLKDNRLLYTILLNWVTVTFKVISAKTNLKYFFSQRPAKQNDLTCHL